MSDRARWRLKRVMDVTVASGVLILLAPLLGIVAAVVRLRLGRPVLFRQDRPGRGGRNFTMIKFRTMTDARDRQGALLADSERLTRVGVILRQTSLDEMPELWNVVKGDMSLVGPRPLLTRYTPYFTPEELRRFDVRPGITGWAQVNGRNRASWTQRLSDDLYYVDNMSLRLDARILMLTLLRVVSKKGLVTDPGSEMQDFDVERRSQHG